jgi:hypothetical protein
MCDGELFDEGGRRRTSASWGVPFFCMHPTARAGLANAQACVRVRVRVRVGVRV